METTSTRISRPNKPSSIIEEWKMALEPSVAHAPSFVSVAASRVITKTRRQRDELANEIALAAEVQQGILPRSIARVPGFDLAARMYPAKTVAGNYYGFILLPAGEIAVVIADVSGKGVAAGLLMPSIEVALRMNAPPFPSTRDLLQLFNNVVCQVTSGLRFISQFMESSAHSRVPWNIQTRVTIRRC